MVPLEEMLYVVSCPACSDSGDMKLERRGGNFFCVCPNCGKAYPYRDGILDLLPEDISFSPAQRFFLSDIWVKGYDLYRHSILAIWTTGMERDEEKRWMIDSLDLAGDEVLLDLACGSGYFTEAYMEAFPGLKVIGCDLSPKMLGAARDRLEGRFGDRLFLVRGDAMNIPFKDGSFTRLSCCGGLHDFPDPYESLSEISRVINRSGARFVGLTLASRDSDDPGLLKEYSRRLVGTTWVGVIQLEKRLREEGFDDFRCEYSRSIAYFSACR